MSRRPPGSTLTCTLWPYTPLCRSEPGLGRRGYVGRLRLGCTAGALPAVASHLSDVPRRALLRQQSLYLERAGGTAASRALAEGRAAAQATLAGRRRVRSAAAARLPAAVVHAGRGDGAHLGAAWGEIGRAHV